MPKKYLSVNIMTLFISIILLLLLLHIIKNRQTVTREEFFNFNKLNPMQWLGGVSSSNATKTNIVDTKGAVDGPSNKYSDDLAKYLSNDSMLQIEYDKLKKEVEMENNKLLVAKKEKELRLDKKPLDKESDKKEVVKAANVTLIPNMSCKFFNTDSCPANYPVNTGASIGIDSASNAAIKCNGKNNSRQAKAVATIKNGAVQSVEIIDSGSGYKKKPSIRVVGGNGAGCICKALSNGKEGILRILVKDGGHGYESTPNVIISSPDSGNSCLMCCNFGEK